MSTNTCLEATVDERRIVSSTGALSLSEIPDRLILIDADYIGFEMGSVWSCLGAKATVIEFSDRITPGMDGEVTRQLQRRRKPGSCARS